MVIKSINKMKRKVKETKCEKSAHYVCPDCGYEDESKEDEKYVSIKLSMPASFKKKLLAHSERVNISVSELFRKYFEIDLKKK